MEQRQIYEYSFSDATPTTPIPTTAGPTQPPITEGVQRTVIFVQKQTNDGQDLFVRGGVDGSVRPGKIILHLKFKASNK